MNKYVEFGQQPEEGMELFGFSCDAILEGKDLKEKILELLRKGETGFRDAVMLFRKEGFASFNESKKLVDHIKKDMKKYGKLQIMKSSYKYSIDRVFWAKETDIPKDPRYFKLNVIDCQNIDTDKYLDEHKNFNAKKFIKESVIKKKDKVFEMKEFLGTINSEGKIEYINNDQGTER